MLSIGRIGAGDGYRYLTDQVATQDAPRAGEALLGYYERTGYPPGVWLGAQAQAFGLTGTVDAVGSDPALARFTFRAKNRWVEGARSRTEIRGFFGAGQEDGSRKAPFVLEGDEPPVLLGRDAGANAVEVLLHALASCLVVGFVYNASARGIRIDGLELDLEGTLDLRGFLGLSETVRPGYDAVKVTGRVRSEASDRDLQELWELSQRVSPVLDMLRNPVPVALTLQKM